MSIQQRRSCACVVECDAYCGCSKAQVVVIGVLMLAVNLFEVLLAVSLPQFAGSRPLTHVQLELLPSAPVNSPARPARDQLFFKDKRPVVVAQIGRKAGPGAGIEGKNASIWQLTDSQRAQYASTFNLLSQSDGLALGSTVKQLISKTGLSAQTLSRVFIMADADGDGRMTRNEFFVAMKLIMEIKHGAAMPFSLPEVLQAELHAPLSDSDDEMSSQADDDEWELLAAPGCT